MNQEVSTGILLDETTELTLSELSQACSSSTEWVIELVDEGILEYTGQRKSQWRFSGTSLLRARTAMRLQHDLEINLAGVALALDLMEQLETMRERLRRLEVANRS